MKPVGISLAYPFPNRALPLGALLLACACAASRQEPEIAPGPQPAAEEPDQEGVAVELPPQPRREPERARVLVERGRALREDSANFAAALEQFESALALDPESTTALWELGWTYQLQQRWADALAAWERLRELEPDYPGLDLRYPVLLMRRDRAEARARLPEGTYTLEVEEEPRLGPRLRIAAVGDIQLGLGWPESELNLPPDNAAYLFTKVGELLNDVEITFGNLETVLADTGDSDKCGPRARNCYAFRAPRAYARTLNTVGFNVLSTNNNHASDFGEAGRESTIAALDSAGIVHSGPASGVGSWETNGLEIALVAFSTGDGPYRIQHIDSARAAVIEADREHDLVIVSFHGGAEGAKARHVPRRVERAFGENRGDVYAFAHAMVDAGADLVLGHGPHVLRGMEIYRGRLIAYSLGNFSTWHVFTLTGPLGLSTVLQVTLATNGVVTEATLHPIFLDEPGVPTPDPERRSIEIIRTLSKEDFGDALFDEEGRYRRSGGSSP